MHTPLEHPCLPSQAVLPSPYYDVGCETIPDGIVWERLLTGTRVQASKRGSGELGRRSGEMMLEVHDLEVRYGPIRAVKRLELSVRDGSVVGLLGANGAGKSTTLR